MDSGDEEEENQEEPEVRSILLAFVSSVVPLQSNRKHNKMGVKKM